MSSLLFEKKYVDINSIGARLTAIMVTLSATAYLINMPLILALAAKDLGLTQTTPLWLGGVFLGGVALAMTLSTLFILLVSWRSLIFISGMMGLMSFALPIFVSGFTFLLICQGLAGIFVGTSCAAAVTCLGASLNPIRSYALVLSLQAGVVALAAYLLPPSIAETISFNDALIAASCICLVSVILSRMLPVGSKKERINFFVDDEKKAPVLFALLAVLLIFFGGNVVRGTIEPIAYGAGPHMIFLALASSLGALIAALMDIRPSYAKPAIIALGLAIVILVIGLSGNLPQPLMFVAFCFVGGAWNFSAAYAMGLTATLDCSHQYAPLIVTMQIIGNVAGLTIIGLLDVGKPYIATCFAWALAIIVIIFLLARPKSSELCK